MTAKVLLVEDDSAVREALAQTLELADLEAVQAGSFVAAKDRITRDFGGVILSDIRMPGRDGFHLLDYARDVDDELPVVLLTGEGDIPMAVEAMRRGAVDFLRKPFRDQELLDRIQEALSLDAEHRGAAADLDTYRSRVADLTPREQEVFKRVASGQANKVIAIELGISERTVEIHRSNVMQKTGSRSLADLVRLLIKLEDQEN